ncbi:MAG: cache domain-containing protein, partial [Deltaproteobacteria bacterium]
MAGKYTANHPWLVERRHSPVVIILVLVILTTIAFYICYRHHTINTEQILQKDRSAAELLSLLMEERLKKVVSAMESYSNRPLLLRAVKDKNVEKTSEHLVSLTKYYPDIDSLIITDRQGKLWASYPERPEVLGKSFAYRDWYKDVSKEWKSNISYAVFCLIKKKDVAVQISVPIFDETGQVIGILLNTQRTIGLSSLSKHVHLDPGTFITITDRKGQIVYSSQHDVNKEIRTYQSHPDIKKAMAANNKTFAVDDPVLGGRTHYISFAPVGNIGWTVFMGRDKRSILLSEYAYFVQVTAIAFLLFLLIIFFLGYSRKLSLIVNEYSESIINTVREPLVVLDQDLRVISGSRSFYDFFKVKPEDTVGQLIYDLGNKQWDIAKLRELLETILPEKATFDNYEVEHDFATIGRRIMLLNARQIQRVLGKERIILLAIEDITDRKEIEAGLETTRQELAVIKKTADEVSEFAESVINTVREPLISLDQDLRVVTVSRSFYDFFKVKPEDTVGQL